MPRRATLHNTMTKGVLDRALSERIDIKHYYESLGDGRNLECLPQGGVRRRAGSTVKQDFDAALSANRSRLRRRVEPVAVTAGRIRAPNGGGAAALIDPSSATAFVTGAVRGTAFVIAEIDLGAAMPIAFVDVIGFSCASGRFQDALSVDEIMFNLR